jgi:hypothetical protein
MIVQKQEAPAGQKFKPPVSYVGLNVMTIEGKDSPSFTDFVFVWTSYYVLPLTSGEKKNSLEESF